MLMSVSESVNNNFATAYNVFTSTQQEQSRGNYHVSRRTRLPRQTRFVYVWDDYHRKKWASSNHKETHNLIDQLSGGCRRARRGAQHISHSLDEEREAATYPECLCNSICRGIVKQRAAEQSNVTPTRITSRIGLSNVVRKTTIAKEDHVDDIRIRQH